MNNDYTFKENWIPLSQIHPSAIAHTNLREIHEGNLDALAKSMKEDKQRNAILIRKLTEDEKAKAGTEAKFGIIDGHHRYQVAKDLGCHSIKAVESETDDVQKDLILAARMNFARVNMETWEKGQIIDRLIELTKKKAEDIGLECFGLKRRMTFKCLKAFRERNDTAKDIVTGMKLSGNETARPYDPQQLIHAWKKWEQAQEIGHLEPSMELHSVVRALAKEAQAYSSYLWKHLRTKSTTHQPAEPEDTQKG